MQNHKTSGKRTHLSIVNQGVDFIVDHLFEKLTVDMIADHCCFSKYYYNRLFKSVTGQSIYGFIKQLRLETAAFMLIRFSHLSITDIAARMGYSSSNFTVFFKERYGTSPSDFRSNPNLPLIPKHQKLLDRIKNFQKHKPEELLLQMDRRITIRNLPDIRLLYERFQGNYKDLPDVWISFCDRMGKNHTGKTVRFYGISYDDPMITGEEKCLYDLCARITPFTGAGGKNIRKISGGRYICYHFKDQISNLHGIYNDLFGIWMPHRGYLLGHGVCFERYRFETVEQGWINMDLCIPIL